MKETIEEVKKVQTQVTYFCTQPLCIHQGNEMKISKKIKQSFFFVSVIGYIFIIIYIICALLYINIQVFESIRIIIQLLIFAIWFIVILNIKNQKKINSSVPDFIVHIKERPTWLSILAFVTIIYSFISFFYWLIGGSPDGNPSIINGEYAIANHGTFILVTKEVFNEAIRAHKIGSASHLLGFYIISIWMLYKTKA